MIECRLSNALSKIIKLEKKKEMRQIIGNLHDGDKGFCLSGALGYFFGLDKEYLHDGQQISGHEKLYKTFGDAKFSGKCPLSNCDIGDCGFASNSVQAFLIHLNDDHYLSFTEAQKLLEEMKL